MSKWNLLDGFDLVTRDGESVFRVRAELLRAGGSAVEEAVEAGFPAGTELAFEGGDWVVVLPYDGAPGTPEVVLEERTIPPAPGYEWDGVDGQPVLRPAADRDDRPAVRPPGDQDGWRWRRDDSGWVLVPPPGTGPAAAQPAAARSDASAVPAPAPAVEPAPVVVPAPAPVAEPSHAPVVVPAPAPVAAPVAPSPEPVAPLPEAPAPPRERIAPRPARPDQARPARRPLGLIDYAGLVLIAAGLVLGSWLLLGGRVGGGIPDDLEALAGVLGVPAAELDAAFTEHDNEVITDSPPVNDPLARVEASAVVALDLTEAEAERVAAAAAGQPAPGPQLVLVMRTAGTDPVAGADYRYALLTAAGSALGAPADGGPLAPVELRRSIVFTGDAVTAVDADSHVVPAGAAYALRIGRYVMIGVPRAEIAGGAVFGQAAALRSGAPVVYTLTPPYRFG